MTCQASVGRLVRDSGLKALPLNRPGSRTSSGVRFPNRSSTDNRKHFFSGRSAGKGTGVDRRCRRAGSGIRRGSLTTCEVSSLSCLAKTKDAVEALKTTEFADAPLQLAIAYMRLGRQADARAAVEKMLKLAPGATIQSWRQTWNFRDTSILDQAAADLARAGPPGSPTQ